MNTWWSDDEVRTLKAGDVMPLPLMVETNWGTAGWEVNVILVTEVGTDGYTSVNVWSHREPYRDDTQDTTEAARVTDAAITAFGRRLRAVLGDEQRPATRPG